MAVSTWLEELRTFLAGKLNRADIVCNLFSVVLWVVNNAFCKFNLGSVRSVDWEACQSHECTELAG